MRRGNRLRREFWNNWTPDARSIAGERQRREGERTPQAPRERRTYYLVVEVDLWAAAKEPTPESVEARLTQDELRRLLETILQNIKLSPARREMLRGFLLDGSTVREIAAARNLDPIRTRKHLIAALTKVRHHPRAEDLRELLRSAS